MTDRTPRTYVINMRDKLSVAKAKADGTYVYCGRDRFTLGEWGNRYSHMPNFARLDVVRVESRQAAVNRHLEDTLADAELVARIKRELAGKVLACWCHPLPCHCHSLADIANGRYDK